MTVGELKTLLNAFRDDQEVLVKVTDPTDWVYKVDIESVEAGEPEFEDVEDAEYDENGNYIGPSVVIIDVGIV